MPVNVLIVLQGYNNYFIESFQMIYFCVANQTIQDAGVQYILDTVMQELDKNPDRKFIYVEIAFFYCWWNEQSDEMKEKVQQ